MFFPGFLGFPYIFGVMFSEQIFLVNYAENLRKTKEKSRKALDYSPTRVCIQVVE